MKNQLTKNKIKIKMSSNSQIDFSFFFIEINFFEILVVGLIICEVKSLPS